MTQWYADQYKQNKIGYVAHTGDLIQTVGNMSQWKVADERKKYWMMLKFLTVLLLEIMT